MERKALGRGLGALIPEQEIAKEDRILYVELGKIKENPLQPREKFDQKKLDDLIASIKEKGVVQPVIVRSKDGGYELIAGERRMRAARALGMENIPVIVRDVSDADALELALIENIQREELNAIEEAKAFQKLMVDFGFSQEGVAKAVGKDRATVANTIRLLGLPKRAQEMISEGELSPGHAKALLSLSGEHAILKLANSVVKKGLSVRETENLIYKKKAGLPSGNVPKAKDHKIMFFEEEMQRLFGTKVSIKHGKKRGVVQIDYYSHDDLERIYNLMKNSKSIDG
ncbi:MAG: ParB/RepB/Spo0J family partition protein [Candidatus Omnitrophica bacterium]|nr:ParB/RepB/Spo0J family partition protein [Candidatus Omnitrophota bacterium]MBU4488052.1 ParB/RepB/Spo0J family partition protein [Candidatus Omnitrophota bacterium]MCG2704843.1 ParB/RepB/Spo0J family partition protein [Candidatus Omnitrophota bacterium]